MPLVPQEHQVTIHHSCFHSTTYTVRTNDPPKAKHYVPMMCPECEHASTLLTCLRCGNGHPPQNSVIYAPAVAIGHECLST